MKNEFGKYWEILDSLKVFTIVSIAPRPGTDFVHSLFDSHPEILTFDGWLLFHEFYNSCISINGTLSFAFGVNGSGKISSGHKFTKVEDFFYEFAWRHLHKFDSRYDTLERKDKLGKERKLFNSVDIDTFVKNAVLLMKNRDLTSKNTLLATYGSFAISKGENLSKKTVLLHHVHLPEFIPELYKDFSDLKVIACMID
jgi:hypothetical protein